MSTKGLLKKDNTALRPHQIYGKFTEEEWLAFNEHLAETGLPRAEFVRRAVLEKLSRDMRGRLYAFREGK